MKSPALGALILSGMFYSLSVSANTVGGANDLISVADIKHVKITNIYYEPLNSDTSSSSILVRLASQDINDNNQLLHNCPVGLYVRDPRAISLLSMAWLSDTMMTLGYTQSCMVSRLETED